MHVCITSILNICMYVHVCFAPLPCANTLKMSVSHSSFISPSYLDPSRVCKLDASLFVFDFLFWLPSQIRHISMLNLLCCLSRPGSPRQIKGHVFITKCSDVTYINSVGVPSTPCQATGQQKWMVPLLTYVFVHM